MVTNIVASSSWIRKQSSPQRNTEDASAIHERSSFSLEKVCLMELGHDIGETSLFGWEEKIPCVGASSQEKHGFTREVWGGRHLLWEDTLAFRPDRGEARRPSGQRGSRSWFC